MNAGAGVTPKSTTTSRGREQEESAIGTLAQRVLSVRRLDLAASTGILDSRIG